MDIPDRENPPAMAPIAAADVRLTTPIDAAKPGYDVVIIGSGYGGAVSALRLQRAGLRVAVFERGREFPTGQFPHRFPEMKNEMQVRGAKYGVGPETGLYDVRLGDDMHVLVGCGVGGGSLINAGVVLQPDARVFADPVWPREIIADGLLDEGYARARRWLRPATDPRAAQMTKFKALEASSAGIGAKIVAAPVAVSFTPTVNPAGVTQPGCTRCGDCCGGCNVGAKNTVALTYLPAAKASGAEIFSHAKVHHIEKLPTGTYRVHIKRLDREGTLTIDAPMVIVSAGTLGSTEILLRSQAEGLALSPRLGERFSANGDIIAFGYGAKIPVNAVGIGHPAKIDGYEVGTAVSGQIAVVDADDLDNSMTIQEGVLPSALAPVLPVMFVPNGRLLGALQSLVSGVYRGPFAHLQTFFAVSHDSAAGRFKLEDDKLALKWPGAKNEAVYQRLDAALGKIVGQVGGDYVKNPLAGSIMGHQPATAHPLGGCAMAPSAAAGVVDHACRVFDGAADGAQAVHEGLYVIDGSVIPRSLGCNPMLTITALAERAMLHLGTARNLTMDDGFVVQEYAKPITAATR